jgi:radical SAM superfamily enzyme YgiQ (UPF0313 family)
MGLGDALPLGCDVWALTGTTPQREAMADVIARADVPVIVGGPHATADPEDVLAMGATAVVRGEGERALVELLERGGPGPDGIVDAARITDLDALAFPDRSEARRYRYTITDRRGRDHEATTMITSRGCPHRCAFCSHAVWGHRCTARSPGNVTAEAWELRECWGYDAVHLFDDTLALSPRRALDIADGLRSLGMTWRCFLRADQCTPALLHAMAVSGCAEVGLGVESGSQAVLDAVHKGETVAQQACAIADAKRAGLRVKAFLIVGLPGETWETIDDTARFLAHTRPDDIDVSVLQVYPGSPIAADPAAFGVTLEARPTWYKGTPGGYTASHRTAALSADDLVAARDYLEARFKPRKEAA